MCVYMSIYRILHIMRTKVPISTSVMCNSSKIRHSVVFQLKCLRNIYIENCELKISACFNRQRYETACNMRYNN